MNTTQSTLENNKIIAEFMGWKLGHPDLFELRWANDWFNGRDKKTTKGYLHFDSDWNWLMEVVIKCKENQIFGSNNLIGDIYDALHNTDIEAVYNACIKFIKWYNEQNK